MSANLGAKILQVIQKDPEMGLDLLVELVKEGGFDLKTKLITGQTFISELHEMALKMKMPRDSIHPNSLFCNLYGENMVTLCVKERLANEFYNVNIQNGEWLPYVILELVQKQRQGVVTSPAKNSVGWFVDRCLFRALPSFPQDVMNKVGGELLTRISDRGLNSSSHLLWSHPDVGPLALNSVGDPAVLSARTADQWKFYSKRHDLDHRLKNGDTVWKSILIKRLATPDNELTGFQHAFDGWLVSQTSPHLKGAITQIAKSRMLSPSSLTSDQWVSALRNCGDDWQKWIGRNKRPAWHMLVRSDLSLGIFNAIEEAPDLLEKLPWNDFERLRAEIAIKAIGAHKNQDVAVTRLGEIIKKHGLPHLDVPWLEFVNFEKLTPEAAAEIGSLAKMDVRAWWGPEEKRDAFEKELIDRATRGKSPASGPKKFTLPDVEMLKAWRAIYSSSSSPRMYFAKALFATYRSKTMDKVLSLDGSRVAPLILNPEDKLWLSEIGRNFTGDRRKKYDSWLQNLSMEALTGPAKNEKKGIRL